MENLIKAINAVMADCENVEKNLNVGFGNNSYKGVADKDVKLLINRSMRANGLAIFPIKIDSNLHIERWEETYNTQVKRKSQAFTEVTVTYLLAHESGEKIEIQGYGHGVDSQDKSAGKATTYALKYALLYQFLVSTGEIDDADKIHSNDVKTPVAPAKTPITAARPKDTTGKKGDTSKKWFTKEEDFEKAKLCTNSKQLENLFDQFQFRNKEWEEELQEIYNNLKSKNQ